MNNTQTAAANLAAYNRRRAAYHLANGNAERAAQCEANAAHYDQEAAR